MLSRGVLHVKLLEYSPLIISVSDGKVPCWTRREEICFLVMISVQFQIKAPLVSPVEPRSLSSNLASPACLCPPFDIILSVPLPGSLPEEKKWFQKPSRSPTLLPFFFFFFFPKLALIRFSGGGARGLSFCTFLQCHQAEIWSSETITVLEKKWWLYLGSQIQWGILIQLMICSIFRLAVPLHLVHIGTAPLAKMMIIILPRIQLNNSFSCGY